MRLTAETVERIAELPQADWDALDASGNPFLRHAFLEALESTGCVGGETGWRPRHLVLRDAAGRLVGAVPQYEKLHSWGEFIFDWNWAQAYARVGLEYYPKLLAAIPFTPVTGPRLLAHAATAAAVRPVIAEALRVMASQGGYSGVHVNYTTVDDQAVLERAGFMRREDCRFLWHNESYADFEHFLARLRADKRKKLRRERRRVAEAGIRFETLPGESIDAGLWTLIFGFSARTFLQHGNAHYLNAAFLAQVARRMPGSVMVKLALEGHLPVAAGVFFRGGGCLYGRYWGTARHVDCLHFELCYYQGIDYCIEHGIERFDPGTQGEHKLARGFEPTVTHSAHWLADARLGGAIDRYLERERAAMSEYRDAAREHLPFQRGAPQ
jgi:hypothetical protein